MSAITTVPTAVGTPEVDPEANTEVGITTESQTEPKPSARAKGRNIEWAAMIPFILVHLGSLLAIYTGVTLTGVVILVVSYAVIMFSITGFYHRYFSHRTFKTSRVVQFIFAFLAQCSCQRGVLWWASHHRHHHKYSDQPEDTHSPVQEGFWYSHFLWIYDHNSDTDMSRVRDLAKYPELRLLNQYWWLPPWILGLAVYYFAGLSGVAVGFFLSTTILWHSTFTINSLSHVFGKQRFDTGDQSRNNWLLALLTFGEGWHNNHHHYMGSTRQGFYWWEIDITYYVLKVMSWFGLVWGLKGPPDRALKAKRLDAVA